MKVGRCPQTYGEPSPCNPECYLTRQKERADAIKLRISRMPGYPALSGWTLNAIISVLMRGNREIWYRKDHVSKVNGRSGWQKEAEAERDGTWLALVLEEGTWAKESKWYSFKSLKRQVKVSPGASGGGVALLASWFWPSKTELRPSTCS